MSKGKIVLYVHHSKASGGAPVAIIEVGALARLPTTHADIPEVALHGRMGLLRRE